MTFGDSGFSLTPGIRFDWYDHSPQDTEAYLSNPATPVLPNGSSDSAFSPKILAEYEVNNNLTFFGQWAMGFRSPTANELYLTYGGTGSYLRIGNPDLEAETSRGFEVGARLGDGDFGGSVNLFYNRYKNFIDSRAYTNAEAIEAGYDPADFPWEFRDTRTFRAPRFTVPSSACTRTS
ncbi:TonB-dependent receptor [Aliirhizobium terrae]|uniref:TonB-dependent receptor domain-containing protein n=1 Tax=Terrirhizobium terrae TaxID=2926709 RepID=UPI00257648D2|nr:TonB-dependent receptor [Rhizobium sp. CC-CFT758]WJH40446.1 TonB-dependent receptor [Rhizobium sp. CC-CFT758]